MAIGAPYTVVATGETVSTATTSFQVTVTATTAAGDCIHVSVLNSNTAVSGVTDSQGNIYVLEQSSTATSLKTYAFVAAYGSGGSGTPTAALVNGTDWIKPAFGSTGSTSTRISVIARGCSGIIRSTPLDSHGTANASNNSGSASPAVSGTSALSVTSEWIVATLAAANGSGTPSAWSDNFVQAATNTVSGQPVLTVADEIVAAGTAQNAAATITSAKWAILQVALTASAISGSATASLAVAATATGSSQRSGSPSGALTLAAAASGSSQRSGAPRASLALTAAATGSSRRSGNPGAALSLAASAAGSSRRSGSPGAAMSLAASVSGSKQVTASGTGSLALSAVASGFKRVVGAVTGLLGLTATATGTVKSALPPGILAVAPAGPQAAAMRIAPADPAVLAIGNVTQAYVTASEVPGATVVIAPLNSWQVTAVPAIPAAEPEVIASSPEPVILSPAQAVAAPEILAAPAAPVLVYPPGDVLAPPQASVLL